MTLRERLLTTLRGGRADRVPWSIYSWILPKTNAGRELHRRGLGMVAAEPVSSAVHDQVSIHEKRYTSSGRPTTRTWIETPVGVLTHVTTIEPSFGSRWIEEFFIKSVQDYDAAEFFFRHTRLEPNAGRWHEANRAMGDGGIVLGGTMPIPIMHLMTEWMGIQGLTEGLYDHPDRFDALIDAVSILYKRRIQLAVEGPAEVIWLDDNITASVISPATFARYAAPVYAQALPLLRQAGKIPINHYDGSLRPLISSVAAANLPVVEAFTPPPMGDLSVADAKRAWPTTMIWVNFPGCLIAEPQEVIRRYTLELMQEAAPGGRFAIGCTEEFPFDHFEEAFTAIGRAMAEYEGDAWPS
jgi:hypothetical protein